MNNQAVSIGTGDYILGVDVGMLEAYAIGYLYGNSMHIIPNHEYRVLSIDEYSDMFKRSCFGTAPLVTPQLKKHVGMILGKASIELNGYHTIPKGYILDTIGYITVSLGDYYNDR